MHNAKASSEPKVIPGDGKAAARAAALKSRAVVKSTRKSDLMTSTAKDRPESPAPSDKARHLQVTREPGKSDDRLMTDVAVMGLAGNAWNSVTFSQPTLGELSLTDMVGSLREGGGAINRGDLAAAERMLFAQAVSLNAISAELARRASLNMGSHLQAMESYMRLALKAQAQCRVTVETLAEMKNPRPVAFVKQANISNGPQQVNNGAFPATSENRSDGHKSKADDGSRHEGVLGGSPQLAGGEDHRERRRGFGRGDSSSKHVPVVD